MTLKTLKDLKKDLKKLENPNEEYLIGINHFEKWVKAEAVKHIKKAMSLSYNQLGYATGRIEIRWIKHFFNITKKDFI